MHKKEIPVSHKVLVTWMLLSIWLLQGCTTSRYATISKDVAEIAPGLLQGYIPFNELPASRELLPPPPDSGSAAYASDLEATDAALRLRDSARLVQAREDAFIGFPGALDSYNKLLPLPVTEENTPYLYLLLRRTLADAILSTYAAKSFYNRERPFMVNNMPTCTPEVEESITDGSYPSGHAAAGWAWALILAEVFPDQADAILLRGREFGESRMYCNVHWYSDVVAGRLMGASTVAMLHADEAFSHDLKKAVREVKRNTGP